MGLLIVPKLAQAWNHTRVFDIDGTGYLFIFRMLLSSAPMTARTGQANLGRLDNTFALWLVQY